MRTDRQIAQTEPVRLQIGFLPKAYRFEKPRPKCRGMSGLANGSCWRRADLRVEEQVSEGPPSLELRLRLRVRERQT